MRIQRLFFATISLFATSVFAEQVPLGSTDMAEGYSPFTNTQPTLADLLTIEPSASIFYSYARELELSKQFSDPGARNTLFVPTNKAVMALARKPHQGPTHDDGGIISEAEADARSKDNVERWVSAHIIPRYPISLSSGVYDTLLEGKPLAVKEVIDGSGSPQWARVILDDGIHVISEKKAANGVLYMIDDTVKVD